MSYAALLKHSLSVTRVPMDDTVDERDEYGQPVRGTPIVTEVRGLVQPKSAREMADTRSAGAEVTDHTIFLPLMDVVGSDTITYAGQRYAVGGVKRFEFGSVPHLEVDARRIGPATVAEGS